jgi:hypothetical protein
LVLESAATWLGSLTIDFSSIRRQKALYVNLAVGAVVVAVGVLATVTNPIGAFSLAALGAAVGAMGSSGVEDLEGEYQAGLSGMVQWIAAHSGSLYRLKQGDLVDRRVIVNPPRR